MRDPQTSYRVDAPEAAIRSRVEAAFEDVTDAGVRTGGAGVDGASDATRKRLEDLGYV
mgnify:CR=1 FL=1